MAGQKPVQKIAFLAFFLPSVLLKIFCYQLCSNFQHIPRKYSGRKNPEHKIIRKKIDKVSKNRIKTVLSADR